MVVLPSRPKKKVVAKHGCLIHLTQRALHDSNWTERTTKPDLASLQLSHCHSGNMFQCCHCGSSWGQTLTPALTSRDLLLLSCKLTRHWEIYNGTALLQEGAEANKSNRRTERLNFHELLSTGHVVIIPVAQLASVARKAGSSSRQGCINLTQRNPHIPRLFYNVRLIFAIAALLK